MFLEQKPKTTALAISKLFLAAVILICFSTVLGVAEYIFEIKPELNRKQPVYIEPAVTAMPTPVAKDETANGKTYRNEEYGFELNYPVDWIINDTFKNPYHNPLSPDQNVENTLEFEKNRLDPLLGKLDCKLSFGLERQNEYKHLTDLIDYGYDGEIIGYANIGGNINDVEKIYTSAYNNKKITKVAYGKLITQWSHDPDTPGSYTLIKESGFDSGKYKVLGFFGCNADNFENLDIISLPEYKTAEQILSTFKFTNQQLSCAKKNEYEISECFNSYLLKDLIPDDIARLDSKLKEYFMQTFGLQEPAEISRGKFDKWSSDNVAIVSLNYHEVSSHVFIVKETAKGKWQASYQSLGIFEKFTNDPVQLVKTEPFFFMGFDAPITGTCVGGEANNNVYRLENNKFERLWSNIAYSIYEGEYSEDPSKIDKTNTVGTDTELSYKDIDSDGNREIIRQGTEKTWKGYCNGGSDEDAIKIENIDEVYKWNAQKQTFIKVN